MLGQVVAQLKTVFINSSEAMASAEAFNYSSF